MHLREMKWSKKEKEIARNAYNKAYQREMEIVGKEITRWAERMKSPQDIWKLHDFLSQKRKEIDHKYDYRYSVLIRVFALLLAEGYLLEGDIEGLNEEKLTAITTMSSLIKEDL